MSAPTITIDMDKPCAECGKGGAAGSGICLKCTTKAMGNKPMRSNVGRAVRARVLEMRAGFAKRFRPA